MKFVVFNAVCFLMLFLLPVSGVSREVLNLNRCIQIGLLNSYSVKKLENAVTFSRSQVKSSYGSILPSVDAGFSYNMYNKSYQQLAQQNFPEYKSFNAETTSKDADYYIRGSLVLFDGFSSLYKIKSAISQKKGFEYQLKREKEQLVYDVIKYYYQLMLDQELSSIAEENLLLAKKNLEKILARVKIGDLSISDQYQQEAKVSEYKLLSIQRQNAVDIDKVNILNKIGYPEIDESLEFDKIILPKYDHLAGLDENALINSALSNRADYIGRKYLADSYKNNVFVSKSELYPKLSMVLQLSSSGTQVSSYRIDNRNYSVVGQQDVFDMLSENTGLLYGLELKWKIFDGFANSTNIQKSKIDYMNSLNDYNELKNNIIKEIHCLIADYNSSLSKIHATESGLVSATQAYLTVYERYNLGFADFTDLAEAHALLVKAKSEKAQSLYSIDFLDKIISYYTGLMNYN